MRSALQSFTSKEIAGNVSGIRINISVFLQSLLGHIQLLKSILN